MAPGSDRFARHGWIGLACGWGGKTGENNSLPIVGHIGGGYIDQVEAIAGGVGPIYQDSDVSIGFSDQKLAGRSCPKPAVGSDAREGFCR